MRTRQRCVHTLVFAALMSWTILEVPTSLYGLLKRARDSSRPQTLPMPGGTPGRRKVTSDQRSSQGAAGSYGQLPLSFEANQGQTDPRVQFLSRGNGCTLFLTKTEAVFQFIADSGSRSSRVPVDDFRPPLDFGFRAARSFASHPTTSNPQSAALQMKLVDANPNPKIEGTDRLPGISNYFIGNDPKKWRANIPNFSRVRYREVYPGIDLVYYGKQGQLEYDLVVAPGADPRLIKLAYEGVESMQVDAQGDLILQVAGIEIRQHKPRIYQEAAGTRKEIDGEYVLKGNQQVGFQLKSYDVAKALVIDPVLLYSTYLGGSLGADAYGIAVDSMGSMFVTGDTLSLDFPVTQGALQSNNKGGYCAGFGSEPSCGDAFVSKLNPEGNVLVYSTYIGGKNPDGGWAISVDASGDAYVMGNARSLDFPVTAGAFQTIPKGGSCGNYSSNLTPYPCSDVFVLKLSPQGNTLIFSTLLGGGMDDIAGGMALDSMGNIYVTGATGSPDFPTTAGVVQPAFGGGGEIQRGDAFVAKLNPAGSTLIYSTFLGGTGLESGNAIAIDNSGNAYVTGGTASSNFPTTSGAFQIAFGGAGDIGVDGVGGDAFVTRVNTTGTTLLYSTYLGGQGTDRGAAIAVDSSGFAYVTGSTASFNFPTSTGAVQPNYGGGSGEGDAFVSKLDTTGSSLVYSTYLGGGDGDSGNAVAVDALGKVTVAGTTASTDFPVFKPLQPENTGDTDAFIAKLDPSTKELLFSTYLGGELIDSAAGIATDPLGVVYITGTTQSVRFPTKNALQANLAGQFGTNAFVAKVSSETTSFVPSSLFLPIVLSSQGLNNSFYTTELTLTNRSSKDAALSFAYTAAFGGGSGTASVTLPAGQQQIVPDTIAYLRTLGVPIPDSGNRGGTLRIDFSLPGIYSYDQFAATARTTTVVPAGRAGLAYSAVPVWKALTGTSFLCGLRQNGADRSNVALQNLGAEAEGEIGLLLTVYSGNPAAPFTQSLPVVTLPPGGFRQFTEILNSNGIALASGYVRVQRVSGSAPYYAYAIVNDQKNSDGSFVAPMAEEAQQGVRSSGLVTLPVIVETGVFNSELVLTNWSDLPKTEQLIYVADAIQSDDKRAQITIDLKPGEQKIIPNFVQFLRDQAVAGIGPIGSTFAGPLLMYGQTPGGNDGVFIGARTVARGDVGSYGVFYTGIPVDKMATQSAWVYGLQQNAETRTNLAITDPFSLNGNPDFSVDLYDGNTGLKVKTIDGITVNNGWKQLQSFLAQYAPGTSQGYAYIRRPAGAGGYFVPYAVINDGAEPGERTGDGAFLSGVP